MLTIFVLCTTYLRLDSSRFSDEDVEELVEDWLTSDSILLEEEHIPIQKSHTNSSSSGSSGSTDSDDSSGSVCSDESDLEQLDVEDWLAEEEEEDDDEYEYGEMSDRRKVRGECDDCGTRCNWRLHLHYRSAACLPGCLLVWLPACLAACLSVHIPYLSLLKPPLRLPPCSGVFSTSLSLSLCRVAPTPWTGNIIWVNRYSGNVISDV